MNRLGAIATMVMVVAAGLLAAFHGVVHQSVTQGAARRVETARQAQARSVCDRLPQRALRLRCRTEI